MQSVDMQKEFDGQSGRGASLHDPTSHLDRISASYRLLVSWLCEIV